MCRVPRWRSGWQWRPYWDSRRTSMRSNSLAFRIRPLALSIALAGAAACAPMPGRMSIGVVYVDEAPPPPRVEVVSVRPGPEFVWIGGYWSWIDRTYAWGPGR